jgi:hypothetical protein
MRKSIRRTRLSAALLLIPLSGALAAELGVGRFSTGDVTGWSERSFAGNTDYTLAQDAGRSVLHAQCTGAASALYKEQRIDLKRTPIINWSWRVDETFASIDETTKAGDDYPARVYVVVSGGIRAWRTRAVNYVWASKQPVGASWPNAFTRNAQMLALRSGPQPGVWVKESRNVIEDFERLHGRRIDAIDGVAIMTDCDNTGGSVQAWYGDIYFTAE